VIRPSVPYARTLSTTEVKLAQLPDNPGGWDIWTDSTSLSHFRATYGRFTSGGLEWSVPVGSHTVMPLAGAPGSWTIHGKSESGTPTATIVAVPRSCGSPDYPMPSFAIGSLGTTNVDRNDYTLGDIPDPAVSIQCRARTNQTNSKALVVFFGSDGSSNWKIAELALGNGRIGTATASGSDYAVTDLGTMPDNIDELEVVSRLTAGTTSNVSVALSARFTGGSSSRDDAILISTLGPTQFGAARTRIQFGAACVYDDLRLSSQNIGVGDVVITTVYGRYKGQPWGEGRQAAQQVVPIAPYRFSELHITTDQVVTGETVTVEASAFYTPS
jgi:hypothetical protein